jgi:DNA polymerase/3'-5' exonuclease PolX
MSEKKTYPGKLCATLAEEIIAAINPACKRVEVAGSVRRGCERVHDIDLVAWPIYVKVSKDLFGLETEHKPVHLVEVLRNLPVLNEVRATEKIIRTQSVNGIPIEIYLVEPDGSNFEALWQMRTGSEQFNIHLAMRAQAIGLIYKAGYGIYDFAGKRYDDGTERGIFKALGVEWKEPKERA